jgi:preprotein translocase subunit SecB
MKVTEKTKSSFQLISISLRKSLFEIAKPEETLDDFEIGIGIEKKVGIENNKELECAVTTTLSVKDRDAFNLSVTMVGKFIVRGEFDFDTNDFLNMNAPSIIYPYIRQHVRTLSLESGMIKPIILPVINFVAFHHEKAETISDE